MTPAWLNERKMKPVWRAALAVLLLVASGTALSGATYTSSSTNPNGVFTTATDFLIHVSLTDPGSPLRNTVALAATASDTGGSSINNVAFQRSPAGANTWTNICTPDTSSPYSCSFNTTSVADGQYDIRALATNNIGSTRWSMVASRHVDNGDPTVTMTDPGAWFPGMVTLASSTSDPAGGTGVASVRYEYKLTSGSTWTTACTGATAPFSCTFNAGGLTNGTYYDFRAIATDVATNATTSATITNRRPDDAVPTASLTDPGTPLDGNETLSGSASDTHSGIQVVRMQYAPANTTNWADACTDTSSPYSCGWDTTSVADGLYDLRLQSEDNAGNVTNSTVRQDRRVDNTAPVVTMADPGPYSRTNKTFTATATDNGGSGFPDVDFQRRLLPAGTWTTFCSDTTSPYSCALTSMTDGSYEFRAVATDAAGTLGASQTFTSLVDNTLPAASILDPGSTLSGLVTIAASATDGGSGVEDAVIEWRPAGGSWATLCTDTTAPYSCPLDTSPEPDGNHEFRVTVTDLAGNTRISSGLTRLLDNTAPTGVTMFDPGAWIGGTVTLNGDASDGLGIGLLSLTFQYAPAGTGLWQTACIDLLAPFTSCVFDTTVLTQGNYYDFRVVALDLLSLSTTSTVRPNVRVDNTAPTGVTMTDPGTPIKGTVAFTGGASDALSGVASVAYQYWNGSAWTTICSATTAPWSCSQDTAAVPDGLRDVRALATDRAGITAASATITARQFDNTAPSVTLTDPGQYLQGSAVTLNATAGDGAGAGVTSVSIQRSPTGAGTWTEICSDASSPYSCSLNTTTLADGGYDLRAVATDGAGHVAISVVSNRRVDNVAPSVVLDDPGMYLSGTITLNTTVSDAGSGMASVQFEYKPSASGTWLAVCALDTTAPFSCPVNTTLGPNGSYDLRAIGTDNVGRTTTSTLTGRNVDNTAPGTTDVQITNSGGTAGRPNAGDVITFTYNEAIAPDSIVAGWDGSGSQTVRVRIDNNGTNDRVLIYDAANAARLALTSASGITTNRDHVSASAVFAGTMTRSAGVVTVTLGSMLSGTLNGAQGTATLNWNPDAGVTDLAGNPVSTAVRNETGTLDADF